MTNPSFTQVTFRLRNDDGSESGATWKAGEGADATINVNENFRCRFLIDETAARAWTNKNWNLYFQRNAGGYSAAGAGTAVIFSLSSNFADGDDCVSRLTGGSGTFVTDNNGMKEASGGATNTGTAGQYFEVEFCVQLAGSIVANGDTINLRIYDGTSAIAAYTDTPVITASKIAVNVSDAISVGESRTVTIPNLGDVNVTDAITLGESHQVEFPVETRTINVSDAISLGESLGRTLVSNPAVSDAISLGESLKYFTDAIMLGEYLSIELVGGVTTLTINVTDAISLGESNQQQLTVAINVSDTITLGEVERNVRIFDLGNINVSDAVSLGETLQRRLDSFVGVSDAVTLGETLARMLESRVNVSDAVSLGETLARMLQSFVNVTDAITLGESNQQRLSIEINVSDSVTLGESSNVSLPEAGVFSISVMDSIALGESNQQTLSDPRINVTDSITLGEIVSRLLTLSISVVDSVTLGESSSVSLPAIGAYSISVTDAITLGEVVTVSPLLLEISKTDAIALSESQTTFIPWLNVSVTDAIVPTDSPTLLIPQLSISVIDSLTVTDIPSVLLIAVYLGTVALTVRARDELTIVQRQGVGLPSDGAYGALLTTRERTLELEAENR